MSRAPKIDLSPLPSEPTAGNYRAVMDQNLRLREALNEMTEKREAATLRANQEAAKTRYWQCKVREMNRKMLRMEKRMQEMGAQK